MSSFGTLLRYEIKKILGRKRVWITLAVTLILCSCPIVIPLFGSYIVNGVKIDTNYHMMQVDRKNAEKLDKRWIDQELLEETMQGYAMIPREDTALYITTEEYQKYARPYYQIFNFVRANTDMTTPEALNWTADEADLHAKRLEMLEHKYDSCLLSEQEKRFWRQKESQLKWPIRFEITESYYSLFSALATMCFMIPLCLAVCLSHVFSEEHARRTDQLILCGRKGRSEVYLAKISAGVIFSAVCSLAISFAAFLLSFAIYGAGGFHAAFQLLYADYSFSLTVGQAILIMYGILVVASVLFAVFIMFFSEALHSGMAALALVSGYLILAMMVTVPERYRVLSQIWDWLPGTFVTPWNIFDLRLLSVFGKHFTAWQSVPVLYLFAIIAVVIAGLPIYRRYQISGR